jgi:hypothetical protein
MADVLIIEGKRVDLYDKDQAGLTSAVNDLGDMTDRSGGYSQSLKIPKTDTNREVFGYAHSLVSGSSLPYSKLECQYYSGGVQLIGSGYAIITDAGKEYSVVLYSGNTTLFQAIDGLKLVDLDLSALDMIWDHAGIVSMYGNTVSPTTVLLDDGRVSETVREINSKEMYFHLFFSTILDAIFTGAGYVKSGDIFSNLDYTKALFPFVNEYPKQGLVEMDESKSKAVCTTTINIPFPGTTITPLNFADDTLEGFDVNGNYDPITGEYTVPHAAKVRVSGHVVAFGTRSGAGTLVARILIQKNGVDEYFGEVVNNTNFIINSNHYFDWMAEIDCIAGDVLTVNFLLADVSNVYTWDIITGGSSTGGKSFINFEISDELVWTGMWRMARNLPDMSQKDFFKMFCQLFGQMFQVDEITRVVNFFTVDEVINNKGVTGKSVDLSPYFDWGSEMIKFHSSYAKANEMKFIKDDHVTEFYGDAIFYLDDETLKEKQVAVSLPVASSLTVVRMRGLTMAQVLRVDVDGKEITPKPRILKFVNSAFPLPNTNDYLRIYEDGTATANDFFTSYAGIFDYDLYRILEDYYGGWVNVLNDYKDVSAQFLLPSTVVANLNFSYPVYVHQLSSWFFLNKIENYKQGKLCKLELQKI